MCPLTLRSLAALVLILSATVTSARWLDYPPPSVPRIPDGKANLAAPTPPWIIMA